MPKNIQKKFSIVVCLLLTLCLLQSCSKEITSIIKDENPDHITDISVPEYDGTALVCLNINTAATASNESPGIAPTIDFSKPIQSSTAHYKEPALKDIPNMSPHIHTTSPSKKRTHSQPLQSVTDSTLTTTFKTYNFSNSANFFTENASRKYNGTYCYIFINDDELTSVSQTDINAMGNYFDTVISPNASTYFTNAYDVDGNNKLIIYYTSFQSNSTLGYFWNGDFLQESDNVIYSNEADMIYMNIDCLKSINYCHEDIEHKQTLSHEFQHLLNYSHRIKTNNPNYLNTLFDTWIEEGIAEGASYYISGVSLNQHFQALSHPDIESGLGLISWTSSGYDYSLSYTFLEYTRIQTNLDHTFYKTLMESYPNNNNYHVVYTIVEDNTTDLFTNFTDLMLSYRIANITDAATGKYGYKNHYALPSIHSTNKSSPTIGSGGSIYYFPNTETLNNFVPTNIGDNIYYYRLNND